MNLMQRSCMVASIALLMPAISAFARPSLHARPLPEGRSFFITTFGYNYRLNEPLTASYSYIAYDSLTHTTISQATGRHVISSELGIMRNLNPKYAVGFSGFLGYDVDYESQVGLSLRGRRWLGRGKSVDVSVGALLGGTADTHTFDYPGFVGTGSMNFNDWASVKLTVTAQRIQIPLYNSPYLFAPEQTEYGVFLGYQIGGKPGLVTTGASALTFVTVGFIQALAD
jgi:hypothetical protein